MLVEALRISAFRHFRAGFLQRLAVVALCRSGCKHLQLGDLGFGVQELKGSRLATRDQGDQKRLQDQRARA